jgi:signal transduction histidine kinase
VAKDDRLGGSSTAALAARQHECWSIDEAIERVRRAFAAAAADVVDAAEVRTRDIEAASTSPDSRAALLFAADALTAVALDCGWSACDVELLIDEAAQACDVSRDEARRTIFLSAVHNPRLLDLPPRLAMEFQLRLLAALAPLQEVTLWTGSESTRSECVVEVGTEAPTRRVRAIARLALSADSEEDLQQGYILGVRVLRWQRPCAALVLRRCAANRERIVAFARETAAALSPLFERDMLLERNARRERTLVEASEKRIARIGYDLHDGPLQDVAAMLSDLRLARSQLRRHLEIADSELVDGRMQDIEARGTEIERSLRELAISLEPKHVLELPFPKVLQREIEAFERRTEIDAFLDVSGDFGELTASQRLALFRVVQEALTNVREHSDATVVQVTLEARATSTELRVMDNGSGFEVTRVLIDAARRGRLGLVGIGERVRMLGGTFDVISRQDEYTELIVSLPVWRPVEAPGVVEQLGAV